MAVDMFMNMGPDIKGETKDKAQSANNDIDVLSWSWGMTQSGTTHLGSGGGSGKVNVHDLTFTKYVDTATPAIAKACATGKHIDECKLLIRKAGGEQQKYLQIDLEDCIVTSVVHGGSADGDRLPEQVALNFAKFHIEYFKQDDDGTTKSAGEAEYDIAGNTAGG